MDKDSLTSLARLWQQQGKRAEAHSYRDGEIVGITILHASEIGRPSPH